MENISCIIPSNEMDLQLDFIFTSVYIGKIKGASKGCVTVSIFNLFLFFQFWIMDKAFTDCLFFGTNENRIEINFIWDTLNMLLYLL